MNLKFDESLILTNRDSTDFRSSLFNTMYVLPEWLQFHTLNVSGHCPHTNLCPFFEFCGQDIVQQHPKVLSRQTER